MKAEALIGQLYEGDDPEEEHSPAERMEILMEALVHGVLAISAPDVLDELEDRT